MPTREKDSKSKGLPPGQTPIKRLLEWGKDHTGITASIPEKDLENWTLIIDGEVEKPLKLTWNVFLKLPKVESVSDFHCVEGWSVLGCKWEGVHFKHILKLVKPTSAAKFIFFECADSYTTSLSIEELLGKNALLAYKLNSKELEEGLGGPLRLVVPDKYGYKSAMWVTKMKFTSKKALGFWEKRGYSDTADVWKNDRYSK